MCSWSSLVGVGSLPFPPDAFHHLSSACFDHGHGYFLVVTRRWGSLNRSWEAGLAPVVAATLHDVHLVAPLCDGTGGLEIKAGS